METHFKLVQFDETQYWSKGITERAGKIYGVYLIDTSEHTYCCEMMPSYCAYFLYSNYTENHQSESLYEDIMRGDGGTDQVFYYHDNLPEIKLRD